jgi:phosphoglycerate dehydrogenase-like enzyme
MKLTKNSKVAVASRSFSKSKFLRNKLLGVFPNAVFNDAGTSLRGEELISFLSDAEAAIIALEPIDKNLISNLPNLKFISKYGVGLDAIDISAMKAAKIDLLTSPGINSYSVAELALASAISLIHLVPQHESELLNGAWKQEKGREFRGKTVGVIGCGSVGKEFLRLSSFFDTKLMSFDLNPDSNFYKGLNVQDASIEQVFSSCDVISIHLPLTHQTNGLINATFFNQMKPNGILINYSRGGVVNENDLYDFLVQNRFAGAAIDVFEQEPPKSSNLLNLPNVIVTPHIGGSTQESILAMGQAAINQLIGKLSKS